MYHTHRTAIATAPAYHGSHRDPPFPLHKTAALQLKSSVSPYPPLEVHKVAVPQSKFSGFKKIFLRVVQSATTVKVILTPPIPQKEPPTFPVSWESNDEELWQRTGACESTVFPDPFGMDARSFFADDTD